MARGSDARRRRRLRAAALLGLAAGLAPALLTGCSSGGNGPPVPTFPGAGVGAASAPPPPSRDTLLPTDCNQLLSKDDLPNLLGLPIGSISATALRDVPAPSVGRLERVTCNYTSAGGPGAPPADAKVLVVNSSGFTTPQAAQDQAGINAQVEGQGGVAPVDTPVGAARGTFYADPAGPILVVVYGRVTAAFTLGAAPVAPGQARATLVDLVQRALPVLVPAGGH